MAEGIIGLAASFLVIVSLILWLIILSKGKFWVLKSIVISLATAFSIVVLISLKNFIGWPSKSNLPQQFQLHWAIIDEPNKIKNTNGAIYMWVTALDKENESKGLPRAYKIDYTRKNHEEIMKGLISLGDGIQQKGEKVKIKEDIDTEEDLSNLQEIVIYELPKPLLPEKDKRRTEQGTTSSDTFNALEIDPETGRPILEKDNE
ncbi:MAG: hypothetical protein CFH26_00714 [Alphaproteobacteria bacterium MarineAlpha6_Bin4]|nr:MAG: hypothetical protein CFH25_00535 [Alphaproteobacteria bacterium MarineAlpha6_Bin3]PPR37519.1 MAG: hypothetical protein CFH26_00714 [Alphaproteobacteria bacterium MarineAlpha6_Bin4]|tara:strand:+ start:1689 stop:2300 length:612 start_codon:yes stop_codon:yes gene_type:complete